MLMMLGCVLRCKQVVESIFEVIKSHHSLVTISPLSSTSNHLFFYNVQFYNNFNTIFEKYKKDKKSLNESAHVYECSRDVSKNGAILKINKSYHRKIKKNIK